MNCSIARWAQLYNGMRIRDSKKHGILPVTDVLAHSSDVGSIKIALRLGQDRFYRYIRAFGFGQQTGIELPGETRGMTKPVSRWSKVSIARDLHGSGDRRLRPLHCRRMVSTLRTTESGVAPRIVATTTAPQTPQTIVFHPVNRSVE